MKVKCQFSILNYQLFFYDVRDFVMDRKIPLNIYKISSPCVGTVLENKKLTQPSSPNDTHHVVVGLEGSSYTYLEGQSAGVLPAGMDEKGKPHAVRLYSIASHRSGEKGYPFSLSLCVKRVVYQNPQTGQEKRGVGSNYTCDLKTGDSVKLTGPVGNRFLLPENFQEHHFIFLATGTGIAPFRGMLAHLFQNHFKNEIWLIFGTPYKTDVLYEEEFGQYRSHPNFHFVTAISREEKNKDGSKVYVQHRILEHQAKLIPLLRETNTLLYICGLKGMEKGIHEAMQVMCPQELYEQVRKRILIEVY
ncbi:MAG: ferredoxin--NADP(+) reductase [Chlamydiae bacterium]|nr:ferredoxin--NADP(+) reductase [Chlamydiota bacterium]MBI3265728.1 ferredoxin--NADP(+) reductase [Chlamydiota bacterium]